MLNVIRRFLPTVIATSLAACASQPAPPVAAPLPVPGTHEFVVDTVVGRLSVLESRPNAQVERPRTLILWPSVFSDKSIYFPLLERLHGRARVVLIDGPGHGKSGPGPAAGFSMKDCARAMKQIMDHLSIPSANVGGTSWGGLVGGEFALLYPLSTEGVVMLNTPVFSEPGLTDSLIVQLTRLMGGTDFFSTQVAKGFFMPATQTANGPILQQFHAGVKAANHDALAHAVKQVLVDREDLASRLSGIAAPTLFLVGQHDDMYPPERLKGAAMQIQNLKYVTLPTRHISIVDAPSEVAEHIEDLIMNGAKYRK